MTLQRAKIRAGKILESEGYETVPADATKGTVDIVATRKSEIKYIKVLLTTNKTEFETKTATQKMLEMVLPKNATREIWQWTYFRGFIVKTIA